MVSPPFDEVVAFVRAFTGASSRLPITAETRLEADLGVTGDDGAALLEEAACHFEVQLASPGAGYRSTFSLGPDEYLFHAEGIALPGLAGIVRWLRRAPRPVIRDLTVGALHEALVQRRAAARAR